MKQTIHKRITSNQKCESFDYMLCRASSINDTTDPKGEWKKDCKVHWKFITCKQCLFMKKARYKLPQIRMPK